MDTWASGRPWVSYIRRERLVAQDPLFGPAAFPGPLIGPTAFRNLRQHPQTLQRTRKAARLEGESCATMLSRWQGQQFSPPQRTMPLLPCAVGVRSATPWGRKFLHAEGKFSSGVARPHRRLRSLLIENPPLKVFVPWQQFCGRPACAGESAGNLYQPTRRLKYRNELSFGGGSLETPGLRDASHAAAWLRGGRLGRHSALECIPVALDVSFPRRSIFYTRAKPGL